MGRMVDWIMQNSEDKEYVIAKIKEVFEYTRSFSLILGNITRTARSAVLHIEVGTALNSVYRPTGSV